MIKVLTITNEIENNFDYPSILYGVNEFLKILYENDYRLINYQIEDQLRKISTILILKILGLDLEPKQYYWRFLKRKYFIIIVIQL